MTNLPESIWADEGDDRVEYVRADIVTARIAAESEPQWQDGYNSAREAESAHISAREAKLAEIDAHRRKVIAENERQVNAIIDSNRRIAALEAQLAGRAAENERLTDLIRWAHNTLYEINPSNYDHDEVCKLNDASVEVILGIANHLGERHGHTDAWWKEHLRTSTVPCAEALASTGAVKVKALEWKDERNCEASAETEVGMYEVGFDDGWWAHLDGGVKWDWEPEQDPRSYHGPDAAKAAAQADYEQRILSTLSDAVAEREAEPVGEASRIGDAVLDWMVKFDLIDGGNEYYAADVVAVLNDLTISDTSPPTSELEAEIARLRGERDEARQALEEIRDLKERPYEEFPADWREQIAVCPECKRYADHPIQRGICDEHRRPLYAREDHDKHETKILGYRAKDIARDALARRVRDGGRDA